MALWLAPLALLATSPSLPTSGASAGAPSPPLSEESAMEAISLFPVAFVPNLGQWDHPGRWVTRAGAMSVFVEERGWRFALLERPPEEGPEAFGPFGVARGRGEGRGVGVRMTFVGADAPRFVPGERLPGRHSYFLGDDPGRWRGDVPLYESVWMRGVYPGVDVRLRGEGGRFEYDLLLAPGADLRGVVVEVTGVRDLRLEGDGGLTLVTPLGEVRQPPPRTWEIGPDGSERVVECRHARLGADRFGFEAPGRRRGHALLVDPGLVYSTYLGGAGFDRAHAVAVDPSGAVTVAGETWSPGFPTTLGAFDVAFDNPTCVLPPPPTIFLCTEAFVTRLSPSGASLDYSTFLGGAFLDIATALALDAAGAATVAGFTEGLNFPTTPGAFDTSANGYYDVFVARLSPTGASLDYSTRLGAVSDDRPSALALDASGGATVTGWTYSTGFPTTPGAFDVSHNGAYDAFVARLSPTGGSLDFSTLLGGTGVFPDQAFALALDPSGAPVVAGLAGSPDFPTTAGAFDPTFNGGQGDAFVARLSATGAALLESTFLGGTALDLAFGLALGPGGTLAVAGGTRSADFPTTSGAFDTTHDPAPNSVDAFVARLSTATPGLLYSTFIGGAGSDAALSLAVDSGGAATVAGFTTSPDFPTTPGAFDTSANGSEDAFVARLLPAGGTLVYSTLLGGTDWEETEALCLDASGAAFLAGFTRSPNFPTTAGAFGTGLNGPQDDAFVARLDVLPTGASAFGASTPGCAGPLAVGVVSWPQVGNASFAITCVGAPPNAVGLVGLSAAALGSPLPGLGVQIWVDPFPPSFFGLLPAASGGEGFSQLPIPLPALPGLAGFQACAQFLWADPCGPAGFSASNALALVVQP